METRLVTRRPLLMLVLGAALVPVLLLSACKSTEPEEPTGTCTVDGAVKGTHVTKNWCINNYPNVGVWEADT